MSQTIGFCESNFASSSTFKANNSQHASLHNADLGGFIKENGDCKQKSTNLHANLKKHPRVVISSHKDLADFAVNCKKENLSNVINLSKSLSNCSEELNRSDYKEACRNFSKSMTPEFNQALNNLMDKSKNSVTADLAQKPKNQNSLFIAPTVGTPNTYEREWEKEFSSFKKHFSTISSIEKNLSNLISHEAPMSSHVIIQSKSYTV